MVQGSKTRMIDDYSMSGVNNSCATFNKIDLHVVDTFSSVVRKFFLRCSKCGKTGELLGKTYDLKSAYRQGPIKSEHLKFGYFSIYNFELGRAQIYRLKRLFFGATHSVYSFLRLSRMLYAIAVRGLRLLTTNFYDDFILASPPGLKESSQNGKELVFKLTGWEFARSGKKAKEFDVVCRASGVQFDFTFLKDKILRVGNTESGRDELIAMITAAVDRGLLDKGACLTLRGKLGFADSFLHGRLPAVVLKRLSMHAYGRTSKLDTDLILALKAMSERLEIREPREVTCCACEKWFIYTDASYEPETETGGLGGVVLDKTGKLVSWYGVKLEKDFCRILGSSAKDTLNYALELLAAVLSLHLWCKVGNHNIHVWFGGNDSVRYALIKASGATPPATALLKFHLTDEAKRNSLVWFARVPTEANISDYPSRLVPHPFLQESRNCNQLASERLSQIIDACIIWWSEI